MLEKIIDIAANAGQIVINVRKEGFQTWNKNGGFDFLTSADIKSEEYILKRLLNEFPDDSILSEENGEIKRDTSRVWMVDPLDGTKDFKHGGTGFSVMIGLCQSGKPVLGAIYAPAKGLLYFAQQGHGAYLRINGEDIRQHVSQVSCLKDAKMVTRIVHGEKRESDRLFDSFEVKEKIPESSVGIKLGLIAEGKADLSISSNAKTSKWDTCAPQILLEEAGGILTDRYGNPLDYNQKDSRWENYFAASNGILHKTVLKRIREFY